MEMRTAATVSDKRVLAKGIRHLPLRVFPGGSRGKESICNTGDGGLIPGLGKSSGEREWQPTPVFLPGESHRQRSLEGYSLWGCKDSDMTEQLTLSFSLSAWTESRAGAIVDLPHALKEFRDNNRNEALCAPRKLVEQVFR